MAIPYVQVEGMPIKRLRQVGEYLPILKHRDDMTEAQIVERDQQRHKVDVYNAASHATTDAAYRLAWEIEQGVDVFGLIESGFAIRAEKPGNGGKT